MRNAKLWSALLAAVVLSACILGILFTGADASDSRIPAASVVYEVGVDGASIRACLAKAAGKTWTDNDVLEIRFSGEDSSAHAEPDPQNGISGSVLFEQRTIFRSDSTKLPIVIRGVDKNRGALIKTEPKNYASANDFYFTDLTFDGNVKTVSFFAGCGKLVFENTAHNNIGSTYYYGDNFTMDVFYGWDETKLSANVNQKGLLETGITFGNGCTGLCRQGFKAMRLAAVGYDGTAQTNPVIFPLKRATSAVTEVLTEEQVQALKEAAPLATYAPGNLVSDAVVKPWNTATHLVLDCGEVATKDDTTPDYTACGARKGVSPVREATVELLSGGTTHLSSGDNVSDINETYVGDTRVIVRGGRSGEEMEISSYSDVGIRLSNVSMYVGNMTLEYHEDDPSMPTYTPWIQCSAGTPASKSPSCIFGDFHFLMTGGTIGRGHSVYSKDGSRRIYADTNDGYWGAPFATGSVVNEVRGGKIWAFYGSRYAMPLENTSVSTILPGTGETLSAKVSIHNIITGGEIGGEPISGIGEKDLQAGVKGFWGQQKGTDRVASVCNEITGGTLYGFYAGNSTDSAASGTIYNFIYGTKKAYPTFLTHFYGTNSTSTTDCVTNVIKGYPVFQAADGAKMSIFGGCKSGIVEHINNYLGGMPVFDDFYGACSGEPVGNGKSSEDCVGVGSDVTTTIALDMTADRITNQIWGGNGYHTIKGVNGATANKGHSSNYINGSITCNVYSGHFGTFRAESAYGKTENVPITVNIYGGKWTDHYMSLNRVVQRNSSSACESVVTTNIYDGLFIENAYIGGQNANNRDFVNNIYGGTFKGIFYAAGDCWVRSVTNNIYGGTFEKMFCGGGYACGSEKIVNNIYGGTFSDDGDMMGAVGLAVDSANRCAGTIENHFYGGDFGSSWTFGGHRNGPAETITNHFYSGEDNPVRDPENELYKYFDKNGNSTHIGGTYLDDQFVCGSGYTESYVDVNTVKSIVNTFEGGVWTVAKGSGHDCALHGGMRWGTVETVTNNFIKGDYYRFYGGCDYGYVTGSLTNHFGKPLKEGETPPQLSFSGYVSGGGLDQTNNGTLMSERIADAKKAASPTATQKAWLSVAARFGDDYEGGAKNIVNNIHYGEFHLFNGGSLGSVLTSARAVSHIDTVTNNVYGGTFEKLSETLPVFNGGCYHNGVITAGIVNNISGGTFNGSYFGASSGRGTLSCPSVDNNVYGGAFSELFGLGECTPDTLVGSVCTTLRGGKLLGDLYAIDKDCTALPGGGKAVMNAEQTDGLTLNFGGTAEIDCFISNGSPLGIYSEAYLEINRLIGTLNLKQKDGWLARDYLKLPSGSSYSLDESESRFGYAIADDTVLIKGAAMDVYGVSVRLEENLGLRFVFDRNYVDSYGSVFSYEVFLGDEKLAAGSYGDLEPYENYYSFVVSGIGLSDFDTTVTLKGNVINGQQLSVMDLIKKAKQVFTDEWLGVLEALENLHNVYNLNLANVKKPELVKTKNRIIEGPVGSKAGKRTASLAMADSVAMICEFELSEAPSNFTVKVNGERLDGYHTVRGTGATARVRLFLPVKARYMEDVISVEFSSDSGIYFTYDFSIAALAEELATSSEGTATEKKNATALLYYVQQAVNCVK